MLCVMAIMVITEAEARAMPDDPLRDAHTALRQAIADLKAIGVPVPMSLYMAVHALSYALRDDCTVLPFKPQPFKPHQNCNCLMCLAERGS